MVWRPDSRKFELDLDVATCPSPVPPVSTATRMLRLWGEQKRCLDGGLRLVSNCYYCCTRQIHDFETEQY